MSSVLNEVITKNVLEATNDDEPPQESINLLMKYCEDSNTKDIVYDAILTRAKYSKQDTIVLTRCVQLWKRYLSNFVPNSETLSEIDTFCGEIMSTCKNEAILKSTSYIRTVISKHLTGNEKIEKSETTGSLPKQTIFEVEQPKEILISNLLKYKVKSSPLIQKGQPALGPAPLVFCDLFGGLIRKVAQSGKFEADLDNGQHQLTSESTKQQVLTVSKTKKREEIKVYEEEGQIPVRRKGPHLFMYKYYSTQDPLELSEDKMRPLLDAIMNPSNENPEAFNIASKVMMKLFMDQYHSGSSESVDLILSILIEMLDKTHIIQKHAFDLLFNLSIHANLFEDPKIQQNLVYTNELIQEDLYYKLKEMLYYIFHKRIQTRSVWSAALNCLLYMITFDGKIDKQKVSELDIRFIPVFLSRVQPLSDNAVRYLVQIMTNLLSLEAQDNLFLVIFDFILTSISNVKKEESNLILLLLKRLGAPHSFTEIFYYSPPEFVETFTKFLFDRFKKDSSLTPFAETLNKDLLTKIISGFEKLAIAYNQPHKEFQELLSRCIRDEKISPDNLSIIQTLLSSESNEERKDGENLLFSLIDHFKMGESTRKVETEISKAIESLQTTLLQPQKPKERNAFLRITYKLLLQRKNKISKQWTESEIASLFALLNEKLTKIVNIQEVDEENLLLMFDIIFNISTVPFGEISHDKVQDAFLAGEIAAPYYLLKGINISILHHIFMNLTQINRRQIRTVVLAFIIEHCKSKIKLESIGGINFFKGLLASRDPQIAFHASRFLVSQLMSEHPEKYKQILDELILKAQEKNDEQILQNPYLQMHTILESLESYR